MILEAQLNWTLTITRNLDNLEAMNSSLRKTTFFPVWRDIPSSHICCSSKIGNLLQSLVVISLIDFVNSHNGNILLDRKGHITHIDFGFMLMNSPGSVGFELAPFKMPQEYIDILGGIGSEKFEDFRELVKLGFLALRKRSESLISILEIMEKGWF